jgi:nitrogenase molybdenum-iron protein beta chain
LPTPYANTPSFTGSHVNGYDAMTKSILATLTEGKKAETANDSINLIPGFEANTGNVKEYKRMLDAFGVDYTVLGDVSDTFDSPLTGKYSYYPGGTPLEDAAASINAKATLVMQSHSTRTLTSFLKSEYVGETAVLPMPVGVKKTDEFLLKLAELTGQPVPEVLKKERGLAVDALTDSHQYLHGKKFAIFGDPDPLLGLVSFLLEMGAKPWHILCSKTTKKWEKDVQHLLDASPYGAGCQVWPNRDLWHLRSLLLTDPVDLLIGDTHGKFAARDAGIPLVRFGFPTMDRVNLHRIPFIGYQGAINLVTTLANTLIDEVDRNCDDRMFEMMR